MANPPPGLRPRRRRYAARSGYVVVLACTLLLGGCEGLVGTVPQTQGCNDGVCDGSLVDAGGDQPLDELAPRGPDGSGQPAAEAEAGSDSSPPEAGAARDAGGDDLDAGRTGDAGAVDDLCPQDPNKEAPGACGCGRQEGTCDSTVACTGDSEGPVLAFVLAGQSNMVGQGIVSIGASELERNGGMGTLQYVVDDPSTAATYAHLRNSAGEWVERDDVWIIDLEQSGRLGVGYGADSGRIGPELQFGHAVGAFFDNPVVLIKTSWGGKSVYTDFRPPSAGGEVGPYYTLMVERIRSVLGQVETTIPALAGREVKLAGFAWHQGWNDRVNQAANDEYQENMAHLVNDLRNDLAVADLPFALATTGMSGWEEAHPRALSLMEAQLALASDARITQGRVRAVETRDYWRGPEASPRGANQAFHWCQNAETYLLIGNGLAESMIDLVAGECLRASAE